MNGKEAIYIMCPYYKYSDGCYLACEGMIQGTTIKTIFQNKKDKEEYIDDFCLYWPNGCPIQQEISERTEAEDAIQEEERKKNARQYTDKIKNPDNGRNR